jgi:hypothetical protein
METGVLLALLVGCQAPPPGFPIVWEQGVAVRDGLSFFEIAGERCGSGGTRSPDTPGRILQLVGLGALDLGTHDIADDGSLLIRRPRFAFDVWEMDTVWRASQGVVEIARTDDGSVRLDIDGVGRTNGGPDEPVVATLFADACDAN